MFDVGGAVFDAWRNGKLSQTRRGMQRMELKQSATNSTTTLAAVLLVREAHNPLKLAELQQKQNRNSTLQIEGKASSETQ